MKALLLPLTLETDVALDSILYVMLVPELEQREAATFTHVSWNAFSELDWREKAAAIAHHRAHNLIEAHVQDAVNRYMEAERRRNSTR